MNQKLSEPFRGLIRFLPPETVFSKERVEEVLSTLTPRERQVLELRFGLLDGHPRTLKEVGKELGVTPERVRQIQARAQMKLRHRLIRKEILGDK